MVFVMVESLVSASYEMGHTASPLLSFLSLSLSLSLSPVGIRARSYQVPPLRTSHRPCPAGHEHLVVFSSSNRARQTQSKRHG